MSEIHSSELLNQILERADSLCRDNRCSGLNRDYILVAAMAVLDECGSAASETSEEIRDAQKLLAAFSRDESLIRSVLDQWHEKKVPITESMILSVQKGKALNLARSAGRSILTADLYLSAVLGDRTPSMAALTGDARSSAADISLASGACSPAEAEEPAVPEEKPASAPADAGKPAGISAMVQQAKNLQSSLQETVLGQQFAVNVFASGFFQAELQAETEKGRRRPRATFLFAGPPGVGKTFLSEEAARILGLPFHRFDMSEYTDPSAVDALCGYDKNYKTSKEGLLTGFVAAHSHCILLFDEIEKASLEVIHLFLQILDAGRLKDNRTEKEVSFADTILIFTTNAGKSLYEDESSLNLSRLSRDVILDALSKDTNPKTGEAFFPAAICSRFASGNVIMFNHLEAHSLRQIIVQELQKRADDLREAMGIEVSYDEHVATAILLAEGAAVDARTARSRASAFFGQELYELFRLLSAEGRGLDVDRVRKIRFSVNHEGEEERVNQLFIPKERIHALAYSASPLFSGLLGDKVPVIHYAEDASQARDIINLESIQLVFCDLFSGDPSGNSSYLNLEDRHSQARTFLLEILEKHPGLPVVLLVPEGHTFTEEEKISYLRRGVKGFLSLHAEKLQERVEQFAEIIFQQNCLTELARGNQLIRFETAQRISPDGVSADVIIFDMKPDKAVKSEDAGNILSMLSTPDVRFGDVIGADDAKRELQFFVSYMKNPKKYHRKGLSSPRGVLLYGPPGTGKTMLAKAFAAESGATFLATEGNQFFKGIVGQGAAMVHKIFAAARRYAPSVIFIDEIDTIARARSGRDTDLAQDSEQILTALFAEMDGFGTSGEKPVFVLGATNYSPDPNARMRLDPAMLRRFDRRILIDLPNQENRKVYLKNETDKRDIFRLSPDGINSLADRSAGMSLAQLSSMLDLSIRTAVQNQLDYVTDSALEEAFETFNSGESKKRSRDIMLRTARHEAGHALISWLSGDKPSYITIVSRGDYGGYMQHANQEERTGYTKQELIGRIRTALGGRAAEIVYYGRENGLSTGASGDLETATDLAERMLCRYGMDEEFGLAVIDQAGEPLAGQVQSHINELLKVQLEEAIRLIQAYQDKVSRLVSKLMESNSLREQEIDRILSAE